MKIDRDVLEKKLLIAINEIITSKDFNNKTLDNIKGKLYQRNILNATQLLNRNIPLNTVSIQVLYALSEAIYDETELYSINPEKYFLTNEIEIYKTFKRDISEENDIVEFDNMIQIDEIKTMYFKPYYKIGKGMGSIELVNNNNNDLEDCFPLTEHELIMAIKYFEDNYC